MADHDKVACIFCITDGLCKGFGESTKSLMRAGQIKKLKLSKAVECLKIETAAAIINKKKSKPARPALLCRSYAKAKQAGRKSQH